MHGARKRQGTRSHRRRSGASSIGHPRPRPLHLPARQGTPPSGAAQLDKGSSHAHDKLRKVASGAEVLLQRGDPGRGGGHVRHLVGRLPPRLAIDAHRKRKPFLGGSGVDLREHQPEPLGSWVCTGGQVARSECGSAGIAAATPRTSLRWACKKNNILAQNTTAIPRYLAQSRGRGDPCTGGAPVPGWPSAPASVAPRPAASPTGRTVPGPPPLRADAAPRAARGGRAPRPAPTPTGAGPPPREPAPPARLRKHVGASYLN